MSENQDDRDSSVVKLDFLADQLILLAGIVEKLHAEPTGNHQTVVHKSEGMTGWGAAAVTACFFTMLVLIAALIVAVPEIHDLKAWQQVHQNHISAIEARAKQYESERDAVASRGSR